MSAAVFEPVHDYNAQPVMDVLAFFKKNRLEHLARYKTLTEAQLSNSSLHPRLKVLMTPVDLALFHAEHDDHHLVRVNEILSLLRK
jgi:hypothetical protein